MPKVVLKGELGSLFLLIVLIEDRQSTCTLVWTLSGGVVKENNFLQLKRNRIRVISSRTDGLPLV